MSWTVQLVRSTPLTNLGSILRVLQRTAERIDQRLVADISDELLCCVKLELEYDCGFVAEMLMAQLMRLLEDGEWMLFVETRDSDIFGDPVRLLAITDKGFANVESMDLVRMIVNPMVEILEENTASPVDTEAWNSLLRKYTWSLFAHLTFRGIPSQDFAESSFRKWVNKLNRELYGIWYSKKHTGIIWVRGEELQEREVIHYHALIGHGPVAAPFGKRLTAEFAEATWDKIAGNGCVELYDPQKCGISYLVKKYTPEFGRIVLSDNMEAAPL